jgi:hypothetical protein
MISSRKNDGTPISFKVSPPRLMCLKPGEEEKVDAEAEYDG